MLICSSLKLSPHSTYHVPISAWDPLAYGVLFLFLPTVEIISDTSQGVLVSFVLCLRLSHRGSLYLTVFLAHILGKVKMSGVSTGIVVGDKKGFPVEKLDQKKGRISRRKGVR